MRTFIAIELPPEIKMLIAEFQERLKKHRADISWAKPENMHLTLKFLGEVDEETINKVFSSTCEVCYPFHGFKILVRGAGGFPSLNRPRVLWVGLEEPSGTLLKLQNEIDRCCEKLGFVREEWEFKAHLTIGRVKSPKFLQSVVQEIQSQIFDGGSFFSESVVVMKSNLRPTGAEYQKLYTARFQTPDTPRKQGEQEGLESV